MQTNPVLVCREKPEDIQFVVRKQARGNSGFVPDSLDEKTRSVEVVAATEAPSDVYDPNRYEVVKEVLLMNGARIPDQVPLTIEHYRSAEAAIGSLREMRVEGDQLLGRVYFSTSADAEPYWIKVKEGHLDRFSIAYPADARESVYIAEGETGEVAGKSYEGPILITKSWTPKALGLVLFPADENAKARHKSQHKEKETMDPKLRAFLERCGLSKDATDAEAEEFMKRFKLETPAQPQPAAPAAPAQPAAEPGETPEQIATRAAQAERGRVTEITAMCMRFNCDDLARGMIDDGTSIDVARAKVMDHLAAAGTDDEDTVRARPPVTVQKDARDKFRAAAGDALVIRAGLTIENPAPGADDLTGYSLREMARHALQVAGQSVRGNPMEMVGRALTVSDFPLILANTANKALLVGWDTAEETWKVWCGTGSATDFKTHSAARASEASDLDQIPDKGEYKYGKRSESQEQYAIATYGKIEAITRHTIINDDLGALTDIPMSHGEAAARKVGDVAYAVLTANAAMGDGVALFAAGHGNLVPNGSGAVPGIATIAAGVLAMGTQKDLQGLRRLNIRPEYFIAPKALEGNAEVFFQTLQYADSDTVATDSSLAATRKNPYAGSYFTRVYEPRLDDNDAAAWFLAARKGKTVKVFFLNGIQKPYTESRQGWTVDGMEYKVRIDVGAKAMDWRGLYMNDGN